MVVATVTGMCTQYAYHNPPHGVNVVCLTDELNKNRHTVGSTNLYGIDSSFVGS